MIAFGCSITSRETFERLALPGIERARESDSVLLDWDTRGNPFLTYNAMLEEISQRDDLEALVLVHQDLEIVDRELASKLRRTLYDPRIAIVGNAGGRGVHSIAWWEADTILGCWRWDYADGKAGGTLDALEWDTYVPESRHGTHEVDAVDGMFQVLSPWAVGELRFDDSINAGGMHGGDVDLCFQARAAGKSVVVDELYAIHHHGMTVLGDDTSTWVDAHVQFTRKWEERLPELVGSDRQDWEDRARRAEAEAAAARVQRNELSLMRNESDKRLVEALTRVGALEGHASYLEDQVARQESLIEEIQSSRSWRLTYPLRRLGALVRRGGSEPDSPPADSRAGRA